MEGAQSHTWGGKFVGRKSYISKHSLLMLIWLVFTFREAAPAKMDEFTEKLQTAFSEFLVIIFLLSFFSLLKIIYVSLLFLSAQSYQEYCDSSWISEIFNHHSPVLCVAPPISVNNIYLPDLIGHSPSRSYSYFS